MTAYSRKSGRYFALVCIVVVLVFFTGILCRVVTRQIVVKKLGITNNITKAVFFDISKLGQLPERQINIDWQKKYPFTASSTGESTNRILAMAASYKARAAAVKASVEDYVEKIFPGWVLLADVARRQEYLLHWKHNDVLLQRNNILLMQNGYLTYAGKELDSNRIEEIADSLAAFQAWLAERKIPLLYINDGSKVNPADRQLSAKDRLLEHTNENGDALQNALQARGVPYIDMRQEMQKAGLDWYASYYRTDHHWKTQIGMWAAGVIAERLNSQYGFAFDKSFFNEENYQSDAYTLKGSQWRAGYRYAALDYGCPDDEYTYFLPEFPTYFSVEIPSRGISQRGKYENTLLNMKQVLAGREYSEADFVSDLNAYCDNVTWHIDAALGIFKNLLPVHNEKKILILQDSFGYYLTTYLACDVAEIHVIHPHYFTGSFRAYVEETKPDMVIVSYYEGNMDDKSFFDFR